MISECDVLISKFTACGYQGTRHTAETWCFPYILTIDCLNCSATGIVLSYDDMRVPKNCLIQRTAADINGNGWDFDIGYGLINPKTAFNTIRST